jgi:hypothetical protein
MDISRCPNSFSASALATVASLTRGYAATANDETFTQSNGTDAIQLSTKGRLLSDSGVLDTLILPTRENVARLSSELSPVLAQLFAGTGISTQPPIEFSIASNGALQVNGDRTDKDKIMQVVNADPEAASKIRTVAAIASHAAATEESMKFQQEYLGSGNPEGVVAKYSYLFNASRHHSTAVCFDGSAVTVNVDGKYWV